MKTAEHHLIRRRRAFVVSIIRETREASAPPPPTGVRQEQQPLLCSNCSSNCYAARFWIGKWLPVPREEEGFGRERPEKDKQVRRRRG